MSNRNESFHLSRAQEELRAAEQTQSIAAAKSNRKLAELHRKLAVRNRPKLTIG